MKYPVLLIWDEASQSYAVECRDIPEVNSVGDTVEEALTEVLDALEVAFTIYMEKRLFIPAPSKSLEDGEYWVELPPMTALKIQLYHEMLAQKITKAELARRLNWNQTQADRLWSLHHKTKFETFEQAFKVLGKKLDFIVS